VWTAHVEVPKDGVQATFVSDEDVLKALKDGSATGK
jgi:hypothetical protein